MDLERAIDTQRFRLLRIIAGLLVAVGFLSVGPVSRGFSVWVGEYVSSILSRAELAARYLVVAQARLMAARSGFEVDRRRLLESVTSDALACERDVSPCDLRRRLRALQALLLDLPRDALLLLRRIGKQGRRGRCVVRPLPRTDTRRSASLRAWRLTGNRVERPPDKASRAQVRSHHRSRHLPPVSGRGAQAVAVLPRAF